MADTREKALQDYRKKLLEHKEVDGRLKERKSLYICHIRSVAHTRMYISSLLILDATRQVG